MCGSPACTPHFLATSCLSPGPHVYAAPSRSHVTFQLRKPGLTELTLFWAPRDPNAAPTTALISSTAIVCLVVSLDRLYILAVARGDTRGLCREEAVERRQW